MTQFNNKLETKHGRESLLQYFLRGVSWQVVIRVWA